MDGVGLHAWWLGWFQQRGQHSSRACYYRSEWSPQKSAQLQLKKHAGCVHAVLTCQQVAIERFLMLVYGYAIATVKLLASPSITSALPLALAGCAFVATHLFAAEAQGIRQVDVQEGEQTHIGG